MPQTTDESPELSSDQEGSTVRSQGRRSDARAASLHAKASWITIGNVVRAGSQWAMIAVLAKFGTVEMVGQYSLGLAVTAPLMLLAGLQLNAVQVTDARSEFSFGDYLSLRAMTSFAALAVVTAIAFGSGFSQQTAQVVFLVGLAKAIDAISDVVVSSWQQREDMSLVAGIWITNSVCSLMLFTAFVVGSGSIVGAAAGSAGGSLLALALAFGLAFLYPCGNGGASFPSTDAQALRRLFLVALPLGFVGGLLSLNVNVPRYFVQHYLGEAPLGLFAAAAYPMVVGDVLLNSIAQSVSPRMARHYAAGDMGALKRLLLQLTFVGTVVGLTALVIVIAVGRQILEFLYRPEYATEVSLFGWIVAAVTLRYSYMFIGVAVTAMRQFVVQLYLRIGILVALLLVTPPLILQYGLIGAALALVIVAVLEGAAWTAIAYAYLWRPAQPINPLFGPVQRLHGQG